MKRINLTAVALMAACFLAPNFASAQREKTLLSDASLRFTGIWGGTNHYYEPVGAQRLGYTGSVFGLEFNKALLLGWTKTRINATNFGAANETNFNLNYNSFLLGGHFMADKSVHPVASFAIGGGTLSKPGQSASVVVWQPSVGVEFNVARWFHLNLSGGYRGVEFRNSNQSDAFSKQASGAYAELGLRFGWSWGKKNRRVNREDE
ncbi:MAG: hypothetical protein RL757_308 [Bacteroidota bacterium]|jgi:hypothetical protein